MNKQNIMRLIRTDYACHRLLVAMIVILVMETYEIVYFHKQFEKMWHYLDQVASCEGRTILFDPSN